jgi:glycosyltransferase involved in cell wall biosynthesis
LKILFITQGYWSYVEKDLQILQERYEVRTVLFQGLLGPLKIMKSVAGCDVVFCWFGKLNAFFAAIFCKILRKKLVLIAGDDDVTSAVVNGRPYGLCAHPFKKYFAYFIFSMADLILPISEYSYEETIVNAKADPQKVKAIPHGFDFEFFKKRESVKKRPVVATIANINKENYHRKGLRLFVEAARGLPEVEFIIIGPILDVEVARRLLNGAPVNLKLVGPYFGQDLIDLLSSVSVYVQASEWESFCCAVAEAMLCECVPVVARKAALPEVVGDAGVYLEDLTVEGLVRGIKSGLKKVGSGKSARERIVQRYSLEKRKRDLHEQIEQVGV